MNPFSSNKKAVQNAYREVFNLDRSSVRIVLADLFRETKFMLPPANPGDAQVSNYYSGSRDVVAYVLNKACGPNEVEMEVVRMFEQEINSQQEQDE